MLRKYAVFVVSVLLASYLGAVRVKKVEKSSFADFQKGAFAGVSVTNRGRLVLGPQVKTLGGPTAEFYLSLDSAKNGDIYIGTGHKAAVFRVGAGGKIDKIFENEHLDVYALALTADGDVVVGTSPNGKVFRIGKDNKPVELFNPEERFIWDVKEDKEGNIVCAMGNTGALYSIHKNGTTENIFTAEDAHLVSLAVTRDNTILAGSGDRGILYAVKNRKVRVLYDSPLDEVRGICEDDEGNIYFAVVKNVASSRSGKELELNLKVKTKQPEEKKEIKEKSILYRMQPDGTVEQLWSSDSEYIYTACYAPAIRSVVIGTGDSGRVYRVAADGTFSLLFESESAQVYKIIPAGKNLLAISNNAAALLRLEEFQGSSGTYLSDIIDCKQQARFGRITWDAELPRQSGISVFVRAGNSDTPDASWSNWSAPFTDAENSNAGINGYRFLQVKVILNTQNPAESPALGMFRVAYLETNIKPQVKSVKVQRKPAEKTVDGDVVVITPSPEWQAAWEADDPNVDELSYTLALKRVDGRQWVEVKKDVRGKALTFSGNIYEDGKYILKVTASDGPANPAGIAKTDSLLSPPFVIDTTAPYIRDFLVKGNLITFTAVDDTAGVAEVSFSLDGKEWQPLFPEDQLNDSRLERFSFTLPAGKSGQVVFIKVADEAENHKVFQKET